MKHAASWILLLCPAALALPCPKDQAKNDNALVQVEKTWARSLDEHDSNTLGCILAEEFEDADIQGKLASRGTTLARIGTSHAVHHILSDLQAHVHGDFGYIRGLADAVDSQAKGIRVRFTDIYVYRDRRWQCVAAHESMVSAIPR